MRAAVGYVRVSTERQASEGVSLDAQRERLRAWAVGRGMVLGADAVFADEGLSGKRADNRPGLAAALDRVCRERGVLVFYSLSRLARSTRDALAIAERLRLAGADLASLTEPLDTTTATGKLLFQLLAVLAEFERNLVSERTRAVMGHKRSRGERLGQVPYGRRLAADGVTLEDEPDELRTVGLMKLWRDAGRSLRSIAAELDALGVAAKGGGLWHPESVRSVLRHNGGW